ncbi:arginine--tRNA ligase [Patescibacteria group bacterium]
MNTKSIIKNEINQVLKKHFNLENVNFSIEYPPQSKMGDYSCNVAMILARLDSSQARQAKKLKKNPLELAEKIKNFVAPAFRPDINKIEVVKPGFINFYLTDKFLQKGIKEILKKKNKFGQRKADKKLKIQVEFISANPTGPLTLANGRGGFSGDVLANVLKLTGHKVEREYYINDIGNQIIKLGHSVLKDDQAEYSGKHIDELGKSIKEKDPEKIGLKSAQIILKKYIQPTAIKAGIKFDNYFSERKLHESGKIDKMFKVLKKKDLVYEKDGAWWLKTSPEISPEISPEKKNDDKDRVLIKSDKTKTYFLADIAYHWNKFHDRKFNKVINLWGADHHGYVARMKSAMAMLGYPDQLEILLMQMMRLVENGKEKKMSKRAGVYVLLEELIDEVGLDVTRFFFLMHSNNKAMDFDLSLAKEKSKKNPVFYVQYAHARIFSIIKKTSSLSCHPDESRDLGFHIHKTEKELIKELIKWPDLILEVAQNYEVHKICFYSMSLADKFHDFYENCQVIENNKVNKYRLEIIKATQQVLQNTLSCLGIDAPEKM